MTVLHFEKDRIAQRFVRYAGIYTQSREGIADTPSTPCQWELARLLKRELEEMGASEVTLDETHCYVYATIPGNLPEGDGSWKKRNDAAAKRRENNAPILGLVAHMDTSDAVDASAHPEIHPRVIENYDGGTILLSQDGTISMSPRDYPELASQKGKTLIVTDGTTVLGGDDKAGIAQIMEAAEFLLQHREIAHGTIRIMFTPDEEVGNGTHDVNMELFGADYAYTVDGGGLGELEYENFNAASAHVTIRGLSTHPGSAKGKMRNALLVAMEFNALLPSEEIPAKTEGYEGFYHLDEMKGTTDRAEMDYIIRDHDRVRFEERKQVVLDAVKTLNERYGDGVVTAEVSDSYYNMAEKVRPHLHLVENAKAAMQEIGISPLVTPIRGGTDGAVLSFRGVPCPNLFTGAYNYHSRYEYVVAEEMALGAETLIRILNRYADYELDE